MRKLLLLLLSFITLAATAQDAPSVTYFYPDSRQEVQNYKSSTTVYTYFTTGSKINSAVGRIVQNGETLGELHFRAGVIPGNTVQMKYGDTKNTYTDINNATIDKIQAGHFQIEILSFEYNVTVDGETQTHTVTADGTPLATTTYNYPGQPATITATTTLSGNKMLSYYAPSSSDGVLSFTFSKPIKADGLEANLEYGVGDNTFLTALDYTLTDDGLTLRFDLRGVARTNHTLSFGNTFYDENGNPTTPTTINLLVGNLLCADGSPVETTSVSLDGVNSTQLSGKIHKTMHYEDITLPTPTLSDVAFYASSNPDATHATIIDGCDMMTLTVTDLSSLRNTDIRLQTPDAVATVAWSQITKTANSLTVALPNAIGVTDNLVISLVNYTFVREDGVEHIIAPLYLGNMTHEVATVAAVLALDDDTDIILNAPEGLRVTYASTQTSYCFIEDTTGGLQIKTTDDAVIFTTGMLLTGSLYGTYEGGGQFRINAAKSHYTTATCDVATGILLTTIDDVLAGKYDNRLVTFASTPITLSDLGPLVGGDDGVLATDLTGTLTFPTPITNLTGIVYHNTLFGTRDLIIRSAADINQSLGGTDPTDVVAAPPLSADRQVATAPHPLYNLNGTRVSTIQPHRLYIQGSTKFIAR